jgi:hypothetical protein
MTEASVRWWRVEPKWERLRMSQLLNFYRGDGTDSEGRFLEEIWQWSDQDWEQVHDFIQWVFPSTERSQYNPDVPLLSPVDIAAFRNDALLRSRLRRSFERMLAFLGLSRSDAGRIVEGPNFAERTANVWAYRNHNWLRITRILRCLSLLGLEDEARAFYDWLADIYRERSFPIPPDTFRYWTAAAGRVGEGD